MIDYSEIIFRLVSAVLVGCAIGLDRNLHGKPTGIKTLGLVALGASLVTMASMDFAFSHGAYDSAAVSRTIQGIITGIGFLGAGVIIHDHTTEKVRGLTTAASIWVTAALGIVCGMGSWQIAGVAAVIVLLLFVLGRPLERMLHRQWLSKTDEERADISGHEE
ncbi:MAG TPA: magnesium transporter [Oxalobacteraceae bacterium]|jgi:putative Mg2+ transporter-C (MgtC) family protein|nr:magnesium transporter [Oxalobacteraceae bacterium]HCN90479.1 magnesium transporter [Oxalobacteraceae bacterium]